jgi:hypothetical protein
MAQTNSSRSSIPTPSLGSVQPDTIVQFERGQHDPQRLYSRLFAHNQNLALWLRRRAAELAPDVEDREEMTTLALELAGILANQAAINDLNELLSGRRGQ